MHWGAKKQEGNFDGPEVCDRLHRTGKFPEKTAYFEEDGSLSG